MSDLIDRDKLKERLFPVVPDPRGVSKTEISLYMQGWNDAITSIIQNEPSTDPKKGRWYIVDEPIKGCGLYECSECYGVEDEQTDFCPYCGAEMEVME